MNISVETKRVFHLELTEAEALWLRAYMQNYPGAGEESASSYHMRKALFDALPSCTSDGSRSAYEAVEED